jgi:hypothetical protein
MGALMNPQSHDLLVSNVYSKPGPLNKKKMVPNGTLDQQLGPRWGALHK